MLELLLSNNFISSIVAFAIILIPAIIIHELGHFIAAKMVGISVLEFGIGFPPTAMRLFRWRETEFTLNWLPIGGFVRPLGEDMIGPVADQSIDYPDDDDYGDDKPKKSAYISEREELMARGVPEHKLQSVNDTKPLPRIWFMIAGATFNVVSALIFFIIAALTGLPFVMGQSLQIVDMPQTSIFSQEQVYQYDTVELINGEYFTSYGDFFEILGTTNQPLELTMRHSRNIAEIETANRKPFERYLLTVSPSDFAAQSYVLITAVVEDSPADIAGLEPADQIIGINGQSLEISDPIGQLTAIIDENVGTPIALTLLRNGRELIINVIPRLDPSENEGRVGVGISAHWMASDGTTFGGAFPQIEYIPQNAGTSISYGFTETGRVLQLIASIPGQLIDGTISGKEARPVSIVGISQIGGQFLQQSIRNQAPYEVLVFIAMISIFLGITNLLPIPALDGGRIVFVIIEMVRGKPIPPHIESKINWVSMIILLLLGVVVIIFDIINPIDLLG